MLDVVMRRHIFTGERPFAAVLDGIFGGISQPDIGALLAKLAASTSYEEFSSLVRQAQGSAGLMRFLQLDLDNALSLDPQASHQAGRRLVAPFSPTAPPPPFSRKSTVMPMIDVYATAGTFADQHRLATDLATALMTIEKVPDIPMFRQNTAAFIHDLPAGSLSNVDGESNYVRIQVLTNAGALDRGKQLAVVERLTAIAADAAGDPGLTSRTWVLLTEAPDGGWGLAGHANTNEELIAAARAQLASLAPDRKK